MHYFLYFLTGLFFCNCLPHLAAGLRGESFPTPFAKPSGVGLSSPVVNTVWGWVNLVISVFLLRWAMDLPFDLAPVAGLIGFLLMGLFAARHFGRVRKGV